MDKPIDIQLIRKKRSRRIAVAAAAFVAVLLLWMLLKRMLSPGLPLASVRMAVVERGPVEAVINAAGVVLPEFEQVIACRFETRILQVFENPGSQLAAGQPILLLDDRDIAAHVQHLQDEIALKKNQMERLEVELAQKLDDLQGRLEIDSLRVQHSLAKTEAQRALFKLSAATLWDVRNAELEENITRIEKQQAEGDVLRARTAVRKQMEGMRIELRLLQQDLDLAENQLASAIVRAEHDGVLTWIAQEKGATLRQGEPVARVADLSRFRVEASVSDIHAVRLAPGMPVSVGIGSEKLSGHVKSIPPNIKSGQVTLLLELDSAAHKSLRPNLRTDVNIITAAKDGVLRVKKGPFVRGSGIQDVFRVHGKTAERVSVRIGMVGMDWVEIESGLQAGDKIIISNTEDVIHAKRISLR